MNKFDFTESEWEVIEYKNFNDEIWLTHVLFIQDSKEDDIAFIDLKNQIKSINELKANARLISCAPEMLKILIDASHDYDLLGSELQHRIIDIIEKATGKKWEEINE